jgi:hypothetical protein
MIVVSAVFTMVFYNWVLDSLSRSLMPIKMSIAVCGVGPNFFHYTSTLLLVHVSQNGRQYETFQFKICYSCLNETAHVKNNTVKIKF